jgi:hypothetical protein
MFVNYPAVNGGASRFNGTACSLATACRAVLASSTMIGSTRPSFINTRPGAIAAFHPRPEEAEISRRFLKTIDGHVERF